MSTPEMRVNDSELVEPVVVHADSRPSEWIMMLREAWSMGRTKVGVGIFAAIVADRRGRSLGRPVLADGVRGAAVLAAGRPRDVAGQRLHRPRRAHAACSTAAVP